MSQELKVGWVVGGYAQEPAIRWRFGWYAKKRGLIVSEATIDQDFDVIWLSQIADYSAWCRYRGRAKLIVDLCDDYLSIPRHSLQDIGRELSKFASRQHRLFRTSYTQVLREMCSRATAVICASDLQQEHIQPFCSNIHQIHDVHSEICSVTKSSYLCSQQVHLVWQGFPGNIDSFREILPVLERLGHKKEFSLHIVTNLRRGTLARDYWPRDTKPMVDKLFRPRRVFLYDWNMMTLPRIATACDLAVIPMHGHDPFWRGKPANKLFIFWRLGIPTLTSDTPAYSAAMRAAGLDMCCHSDDDWEQKLQHYLSNEEARRDAGTRARRFVEEHYSESELLARWDRLLESVLDG